jgi:hypothetical protein
LQAQYAFGVSGYAGFQVFQSLLNSCSLERKFNKKVAVGQFAPCDSKYKNCFHVGPFRDDFRSLQSAESSTNELAIRTLTLFGQVNDVRGFFFLTLLVAAIRKMFGTKG